MSYVQSLKLHNFRCYQQSALNDLSSGLLVLHGPNGAGKTNVLEALSVLVPGRGLRSAKVLEMQCQNAGSPWAVSADIYTDYGLVKVGTGLDAQTQKRIVRINGENAKSQSELAKYLSCVWLTPQMDRLFLDSSRERRRFLDRMVFAFDPGHSGRVSRYENALSQRSKLLKEGRSDPAWLDGLEAQMAETGVAIAAARLDFVERLRHACESADSDYFPLAQLQAKGRLEELLEAGTAALEVEDVFKYQLSQMRQSDSVSGGAAIGPHRSDLAVFYAEKNMPADQCSTGEQKALLIGIILAHAQLIKAERGAAPVILLDEVAAHLDEGRRAALYDILESLRAQVWLTGTDQALFSDVKGRAAFFHVQDSHVMPQSRSGHFSQIPSAI